MNKKFIAFSLLISLFLNISAQNSGINISSIRKCGSPKVNPTYEDAFQQMLQKNEQFVNAKKISTTYNIPIIFHILHSGDAVGSGRNLSQTRINSQLSILNSDFRKLNSDFGTYVKQSSFLNVAADIEINFCAAMVDPTGVNLLEPGIDRIDVSTKGWTDLPYAMTYIQSIVKPGSYWDPSKYYNVWILEFGGDNVGTLGYAQFPTISGSLGAVADMAGQGGSADRDGVVIDFQYIGNTGTFGGPYNKGRTLVHETGHWLGLWHIWGDDATSCAGSDYVFDTPNQADENYTCPVSNGVVVTDGCTTISPGVMYQNYMDYSDDKCMVMFTEGQKVRMQAVMANCVRRLSLNTSTACTAVGIYENVSNIQMNIYPNPSSGELHVDINLLNTQDFTISIINTLGQCVKEIQKNQSNGGKINIDLSNKNAGVYFVIFKSKSGSITKRLILQ